MTKKQTPLKFFCVLDPIEKLDLEWDNSLATLEELARRGHETWIADVPDFWSEKNSVFASCQRLRFKQSKPITEEARRVFRLDAFDLILIRKEPPFNDAYLNLTYWLDQVAGKIPVVNHPTGIRDTNEKLSILNFPQWIPETFVSSSPEKILDFQKKLRGPMVVKPLDQKAGTGVFLIHKEDRSAASQLAEATQSGQKTVMAQAFITAKKNIEKRIVILNGEILALYEKRPKPGEFRANLTLDGTFHASVATSQEKKLVRDLRAFLLKRGLYFVGIDVLNGRLLEINVTCPAGVTEARFLYPQAGPLEAWASFLEDFPRRFVPRK